MTYYNILKPQSFFHRMKKDIYRKHRLFINNISGDRILRDSAIYSRFLRKLHSIFFSLFFCRGGGRSFQRENSPYEREVFLFCQGIMREIHILLTLQLKSGQLHLDNGVEES